MNASPNWIRRRPRLSRGDMPDVTEAEPLTQPGTGFWRRLRAVRRITLLLLWNLIGYPILGLLYVLPGGWEKLYPLVYWQASCALLGMQIRVIGKPAQIPDRPVIFASNHSSWLDIPALGTILKASFVAKDDVEHWLLIGTMAKFARTVFVSRKRSGTGREREEMGARLDQGDNLILFPEGTSSDGSRVLPFRSSFFAVSSAARQPVYQPVSIVYDRLAGLPTTRATRPIFAWYGDMELFPHLWNLAQCRSYRCTIALHPPLDPVNFPSRKALAAAVHRAAANGAAALRQSRPATLAKNELALDTDTRFVATLKLTWS